MGNGGSASKLLKTNNETPHKFSMLIDETTEYFSDTNNSNYKSWFNNLSEQEKYGIHKYTGSSYVSINSLLYTTDIKDVDPDSVEGDLVKTIKNIESGLNKSVLKKSILVQRGTDLKIFGINLNLNWGNRREIDKQMNSIVGKIFHSNGFLSSAAAPKTNSAFDSDDLILNIKIPPSKGAGAWIAPQSVYESEREFLINSNSYLKVTKVKYNKENKQYEVDAEYVGRSKNQIFK